MGVHFASSGGANLPSITEEYPTIPKRVLSLAGGQRNVELRPVSEDADNGTYYLHQLVRIYVLAGQPEKAIDNLERLLKMPYFRVASLAEDRSQVRPLQGNPRFQKLVASG